MIRFGMKNDEVTKYTYSENILEGSTRGFLIIIYIFILVLSIIPCFSLSDIYSILIFQAILLYCYSIVVAIVKLIEKHYISTTYFIIDIIPVLGISMRLIEKVFNMYLVFRKIFTRIIVAYNETDLEEMEYRLNHIAEVNESITNKR